MKQKVIYKLFVWGKRYLPAEMSGTLIAMICAVTSYMLTQNILISAVVGAWGENIGYYGVMLAREEQNTRADYRTENKRYTFISYIANIRDILFEFGPAELLDSFFVRPFMMYISAQLIGNFTLGIFIGKIAADIIFYIPTIVMYEVRLATQRVIKNK